MGYEGYECLRITVDRGVAWVTIDHPPINLFDRPLLLDMHRFGKAVAGDDGVRVLVVQSADPEFFIAHADVSAIQGMSAAATAERARGNFFHALTERFRTMPKVSIAKLEGRARGGGSEFVLSLDLRFGAIGRAILGQPEVALGIIPGGSGTQRLARLAGRGRALEVVLGCEDFAAELAERYGLLNRALPAGELGPFVERLAYRIASFPAEAIALAKAAVDAAELGTAAGLVEEDRCFDQAAATAEAGRRMARFLEIGGQTRARELDLAPLLDELAG
jgi:enoyl-CoA hydratase/carnithine racemase